MGSFGKFVQFLCVSIGLYISILAEVGERYKSYDILAISSTGWALNAKVASRFGRFLKADCIFRKVRKDKPLSEDR